MEIPRSGVAEGADGNPRCWWCLGDPLYLQYHDDEWGRPDADDRRLFEQLSLEGFQAGLSWLTILRKRDGFRRAFKDFEIETVARFNSRSVERLLRDSTIVRHRGKIEATINNARRCLDLKAECGSLADFAWSFALANGQVDAPSDWDDLVARGVSPEATAMSKELRRRGWSFVGPTTIYSFMEAVGIVNDHLAACSMRAGAEKDSDAFRARGSPGG